MRSMKIGFILSFTVIMIGCLAISIHPLYTEKDIKFNPELVGIWVNEEEKAQLLLEKAGKNAYTMIYTEKQESGNFDAHLVELNNNWYLDVYPKELAEGNDFYRIHFIAGHTFARVWIEKDTLKFALLSYQWLKDNFEKNKIKLNHEIESDNIILTASTSICRNS